MSLARSSARLRWGIMKSLYQGGGNKMCLMHLELISHITQPTQKLVEAVQEEMLRKT